MQTYIISLGGSVVVPGDHEISVRFLKGFRALILREIKQRKRFFIIVGGGKITRLYQKAAKQVGGLSADDLDWLGIHATRLNAHLLRTIFRTVAHPVVIKDYSRKQVIRKKVILAAGWKPGWSTDYDAVKLAKMYEAPAIINLTNIPYVYDRDPNKSRRAKPLKRTSWSAYRRMVGSKWDPGANWPFDPVAAKLAHASGLRVIICKGQNLKNVRRILQGKRFVGTTIE